MKDKLESRLEELKSQFAEGTKRLEKLESDAENLRQTLLRISGAVQVLEETLEDGTGAENGGGKSSGA